MVFSVFECGECEDVLPDAHTDSDADSDSDPDTHVGNSVSIDSDRDADGNSDAHADRNSDPHADRNLWRHDGAVGTDRSDGFGGELQSGERELERVDG